MPDERSAEPSKKPTKPRNLYEALTQFADANRSMLEATTADSGNLPVLLSWNGPHNDYRALFGSQR